MRPVTVDVEDYYSLVVRDKLGFEVPISRYVEAETRHLLDLLDELGVAATCFVVGRLAAEKPALVRELVARGHEIASHGHQHLRMSDFSPRTFAEDLRESISVLQDVSGTPVRGFRASAFSLRAEHDWAFEIMAEEGIEYDSSVRVVWPSGYAAAEPLIRRATAAGIREYPGFALGLGRWKVPLGGGGGLRFLPHAVTRRGIASVNRAGFSVPIYLHPYDLRLEPYDGWPGSNLRNRLRLALFDLVQRLGRSHVADRLGRLVATSAGAAAGTASGLAEPVARSRA